MVYSEIIIAASLMCLVIFVVEYTFGKSRSLFDYFLIIMLVASGMLYQKGHACEPYYPDDNPEIEDFNDSFGFFASVPHFPKPKMLRCYIGPDCRVNEAGIKEIRRTGKAQAWEGLNKHADLYYYYLDLLEDLVKDQQRQDARYYGAMIWKACVLSTGGFAQFCFTVFVELAAQQGFQTKVDNFSDIENCTKFISWHGSCAQAHADWCNENLWGTW